MSEPQYVSPMPVRYGRLKIWKNNDLETEECQSLGMYCRPVSARSGTDRVTKEHVLLYMYI